MDNKKVIKYCTFHAVYGNKNDAEKCPDCKPIENINKRGKNYE